MNKIIKFLNKILDFPKLIIRLWITLWLCLIILLIMKFCFGVWYPIVVENKTLLNISDYVDNSWLKYLILFLFYAFNINFVYLIACRKIKYDHILETLLINFLIVLTFAVKIYNNYLGFIGEFLIVIPIPIIYFYKHHSEDCILKDILWTFVLQILIMLWQCNILLVRGLPNPLTSADTIIQIILQLDYYIFLTILWIGVSIMGLIGIWFFTKDVTKLKAIRESELAKARPDMKLVKDIDSKITKLEASK